jgi:hypothetical protein
MRALGLAIVLMCVACAKKPAPKAPGSPPTLERTDSEPAPKDEKKAAPTSTKKPGDPCSGGE